jgi:hypothetical protein
MTFPPEHSPEMDALIHRALDLPQERRTVIGLVESLGLGVMRAKQLQSMLAAFKKDGYVAPEVEVGSLVSDEYGGTRIHAPRQQKPKEHKEPRAKPEPRHEPQPEPQQGGDRGLARKYCQSHGHMAVMRHHCGAYLCHNCVSGASKCPICHQPLHGEPRRERPRKEPERHREPEELEPEDESRGEDDGGEGEEPEETGPKSDEEIKSEYGRL